MTPDEVAALAERVTEARRPILQAAQAAADRAKRDVIRAALGVAEYGWEYGDDGGALTALGGDVRGLKRDEYGNLSCRVVALPARDALPAFLALFVLLFGTNRHYPRREVGHLLSEMWDQQRDAVDRDYLLALCAAGDAWPEGGSKAVFRDMLTTSGWNLSDSVRRWKGWDPAEFKRKEG